MFGNSVLEGWEEVPKDNVEWKIKDEIQIYDTVIIENEILNSKPKICELEQEKKTTETEISQIEHEIIIMNLKEAGSPVLI